LRVLPDGAEQVCVEDAGEAAVVSEEDEGVGEAGNWMEG
jgi:hypothetical protein